jgi:D-tyrosyl-tRNA(Tyr) deacylase
MKTVLQRVNKASVLCKNIKVSSISRGYLLFLGIKQGDNEKDVEFLASKILNLRLFENNVNKFDKSLLDVKGELLVISQFTLFADYSKGRRPFFGKAEGGEKAEFLYNYFINVLKKCYNEEKIKSGRFGEHMVVKITNDGPVTIILES